MADVLHGQNGDGHHINDLPPELLVRIMSELSLFHRKRMRLVCQLWNDISYEHSLILHDWIVVPSVKDLKKLEDRSPERKFYNLRILKVDEEYEESAVFQKFGPCIQKVELPEVSDNRNPVLIDIFKHCSDLRMFFLGSQEYDTSSRKNEGVSFSELMPETALSTLTSIKLKNSHYSLTDAELVALTRNSLHLTEIVLDNFSFLSTRPTEYLNIVTLLKRQSKILTHLTLSRMSVYREDISDLLSCIGEQLISLNISNNHWLPDSCLYDICVLFPNLEEIYLSGSQLAIEEAKSMLTSLKKLKVVFVDGTNLNKTGLKFTSHLGYLEEINLSFCSSISGNELMVAFSQQPMPKIKALIFNGVPGVSSEVVRAISPMVPNIFRWDLSHTNVGDLGVQSIINNNKALRILSLHACQLIENIFIGTPSVNELNELRELNIDFCSRIKFSSLKHLRLKQLRKLSFEGHRTKRFRDKVKNYMKMLSLESVPRQSQLTVLASIIEACPSLEQVNMLLNFPLGDVGKLGLSPHVLKVLPLPCDCHFSSNEHLTQECQP